MNMPIFYIGINKGIVGKNKLTFTLIGYLLNDGKQALLLESDTSNLDVYNKESHSLAQSRLAESPPRKQHVHTLLAWGATASFLLLFYGSFLLWVGFRLSSGQVQPPPCYGCLRESFWLQSASAAEFFRDIRRKKLLLRKSRPT